MAFFNNSILKAQNPRVTDTAPTFGKGNSEARENWVKTKQTHGVQKTRIHKTANNRTTRRGTLRALEPK